MSTASTDTPSPIGEISQGPNAMEQFLDRNQILLIAVAILIVLGVAAFIVQQGVEKSHQETAGAALVAAEGLEDLQKVISDYAGTHAAQSASLLLAEQQWTSGKTDDALATLESFIAQNPQHPAIATAKASLASKRMTLDQSAEAVKLFEEIVNDPQANHLAAYALICIGDISRAAGDLSQAEASYQRASKEFPDSQFSTTITSRLETLKAKAPVEIQPPATTEADSEASSEPPSTTPETPTSTEPSAPAPDSPQP